MRRSSSTHRPRRLVKKPARQRRRTGSRGTESGTRATASSTVPEAVQRDYVAVAVKYCADVVAGRLVAGKWLRLACERQQRDRERAEVNPSWGFVWSSWHANDVCDFVEKLPHVEGTWSTATIELQPVQVFILTTLFGWRTSAGRRRFSMAYICAARKFAKSTLAAAIALYCL